MVVLLYRKNRQKGSAAAAAAVVDTKVSTTEWPANTEAGIVGIVVVASVVAG